MFRYFIRRLLQMIPVILGATLLIYALVFALPGDPVAAMFGSRPVNQQVAAQIRAEYNLDKPFFVQYLLFLKNAVTLDFGRTFSGQPVLSIMGRAFPVTIKLAIMAFVFEGLFGIVFGVISGLNKGKWFDSVILVLSLLLISVPTFVTGFVMQYFLGVKWHVFPVTASSNNSFLDLLMPAMVLGSASMAYIIRLTRTEVSSNRTLDYVRTARAKGISNKNVIVRHILRNSLIPVVTYLGADLGALMGGAMISERIFNIFGVGYALYDGIYRGEQTLVVSLVTVLVFIFVICNLAVDMLYAVLDPRIRYHASQA
ncbi:MAG: ABC transporter permease [Parascardovia denticolens]